MLQLLKRCWWVVVLATGTTTASAFSLGGPINEAYQVPDLAYNLAGDLNAPKNLGEEYRWNRPTLYYAFDQNFLDYFGSNGVFAVEQAMAVFNALTNVSQYSSDLSEFPLEAQRMNYRAQALDLLDIKSLTMNMLMEQLGLADPVRYTWTLHSRIIGPGQCPGDVTYYVIKRNFDLVPSTPDQYQSSSYVNGTLYSYFIYEICSGDPPLADAIEYRVDPLANAYTAVASLGLYFGGFYTGLTRDDMGGLRYLLRANNMNLESAGIGTETAATNLNASQLLVTSNLTLLVAQSLTNDAVALTALYPGLVIDSTTPIFTNLVTTNVFYYYTNLPSSPAGSPATLVSVSTVTTNVATWYHHSFANVVTNSYYTNGILKLQTTKIGSDACGPYAPPGLICTNITWTTMSTNQIAGDYYILPADSGCGESIVSTQLVTVFAITNDILVATNAPGTTNVTGQFFQSAVSYFTNHIYVVHPVPCVSNSVALREGIEKVSFVRHDFDSLIGQYYEPVKDTYTAVIITNSTAVQQTVRRVVTQPDVLFTAQDLTDGPAGRNHFAFARSISFITNSELPGLAGPGTIEPSVTFTFNKVGRVFVNFSPFFLDEQTQGTLFTYGSFDGTTNAPVVYPNGTSVSNLENQVLIQINPTTPATNGIVYLPNGTVGINYATVFSGFTVTGGQPPYSWALSPGSAGLPPNLLLNADGTISGVPVNGTQGLTFDFSIRLTDAGGRYVDRPYSLTITP